MFSCRKILRYAQNDAIHYSFRRSIMSVHLQREIDKLKKSLLSLLALVEDQVQSAVQAVLNRDEALALKSSSAIGKSITSRSKSRRNA